jgi:hypothetical protein
LLHRTRLRFKKALEPRDATSELLHRLAQNAVAQYRKQGEAIPPHVQSALDFSANRLMHGRARRSPS